MKRSFVYVFLIWSCISGSFAWSLSAEAKENQPGAGSGAAESKSGNLLKNGGFEIGQSGWITYQQRSLDGKAAVVSSAKSVEGERLLHIIVPPKGGLLGSDVLVNAATSWYPFEDGKTATFSVYARAIKGSPELTLGLVGAKASQTFDLTSEWKRYHVTGIHQFRFPYQRGYLQLSGGGEAEVDACQLESGNLTDYQPSHKPVVGVACSARPSLLYPGEPCDITIEARVPQALAGHSYEILVVHGDHTNPALRRRRTVLETEKGAGVLQLKERWVPPEKTGLYEWNVVLLDNGREVDSSRYALGVVPRQLPRKPGAYDIFGACINYVDFSNQLEKASRMGVSMLRLHGVFTIPRLWMRKDSLDRTWPEDAWVQLAYEKGFSMFPYIADSHKKLVGTAVTYRKGNALREIFRSMAHRYQGKIQAYQVWNEPEFKVTPDFYAPFHRIMAEAVRREDSRAMIISGSAVHGRREWVKRMFRQLNPGDMDAVALHLYPNGNAPEHQLPDKIEKLTGVGRAWLKNADADELPVWDTEFGYLCRQGQVQRTKAPDFFYKKPMEHAALTVRSYQFSMAEKISVKTLFLLNTTSRNILWPHSPFLEDSYESARPLAVAYSVMTRQLYGFESRNLFASQSGRTHIHYVNRAEDASCRWVVWTSSGTSSPAWKGDAPVRAVDMMGRPVQIISDGSGWSVAAGPHPIYLHFNTDRSPDHEAMFTMRAYQPTYRPESVDARRAPRRNAVEGATVREYDPPDPADISLEAERSHFLAWSPGIVPAEGASGGAVVVVDSKDETREKSVLEFSTVLSANDEGVYEVWAAVRPLFYKKTLPLERSVDGGSWVPVRGLDQAKTFDVTLPGGQSVELAWEYLGTVNWTEGNHAVKLRPGERNGRQPRQICDRVIFRRISNE